MKLPCEVAGRTIVPAIRAMIARELIRAYGMRQREAAQLLGITQTAISKYAHNVRGTAVTSRLEEEIRSRIVETATLLAKRVLDGNALAIEICSACTALRSAGLMCDLCKRADPSIEVQRCTICRQESRSGQSE